MPNETLGAVKLYCGDLYGGMLARLDSTAATQLMNCMLGHHSQGRVHAGWLSGQHSSFREDLLARWVKFYQSLITGPSPEVAVIARMAARDLRSTTGANNRLIRDSTGLDARTATSLQVRRELQQRETKMTEGELAVAMEISHLLEDRARMNKQGVDTQMITQQIEHHCGLV